MSDCVEHFNRIASINPRAPWRILLEDRPPSPPNRADIHHSRLGKHHARVSEKLLHERCQIGIFLVAGFKAQRTVSSTSAKLEQLPPRNIHLIA